MVLTAALPPEALSKKSLPNSEDVSVIEDTGASAEHPMKRKRTKSTKKNLQYGIIICPPCYDGNNYLFK